MYFVMFLNANICKYQRYANIRHLQYRILLRREETKNASKNKSFENTCFPVEQKFMECFFPERCKIFNLQYFKEKLFVFMLYIISNLMVYEIRLGPKTYLEFAMKMHLLQII